MKNLQISCSKCDGWGGINISQHPEPWEAHIIECNGCDGFGYTIDIDELKYQIEHLEIMISGMRSRIIHFQWTITQCQRGLLFDLSEKFENRMDSCARGLARLNQYRNKLKALL